MIANEILEELARINLAPYESRILWFIIRKTYGWHKKSDLISLSQIVAGTGISKGHASTSLKHLVTRNLVTRKGNKQLGFQKDHKKWIKKLRKKVTKERLPEQVTGVTSRGTPSATKKLPAEEPQNIHKETIQKKPLRDANKSASQIREVFRELKKRNWDTPNRAKEAKGIKWMLSRGYAPSAILITYDRLKKEPFWSVRFLSMVKVAEEIGEKGGISERKAKRSTRELPQRDSYTTPEQFRRRHGAVD